MIKRLDSVYQIYKHPGQKKALYLSVNVFSTKVHVLIGDAVFQSPMAILRGHLSHAKV